MRQSRIVASVVLLLLWFGTHAETAGQPFNPSPAGLQTPLQPGGAEAALQRLSKGSDGKTPTVKHFDLAWVRSLAGRGEPRVYTRENSNDFEYIGMPIGGIGAGQLYLGGDGKLWWWDIFNTLPAVPGVSAYADPPKRSARGPWVEIEQGFALSVTAAGKTRIKRLDRGGFAKIEFRGQYPIGHVAYADPEVPVTVTLEAFSPWVPLRLEDSTCPATVMNYTVTNASQQRVEGELAGWLENAVCLESRTTTGGRLCNRILRGDGHAMLFCQAAEPPTAQEEPPREPAEDILFEDFESGTYDKWAVEGEAFGTGPNPNFHHQPLRGHQGKHLADSFRNEGVVGASARESDQPTGKLTSTPFEIERRTIKFLIGGGNHPGQTCVNLVVDGNVVGTATGRNSEGMAWAGFDVTALLGKRATLEIVDNHRGGWGHVMVDQIIFTNDPPPAADSAPLKQRRDYGSMALAIVGTGREVVGRAAVDAERMPEGLFDAETSDSAEKPFAGGKLVGSVGRRFALQPGEATTLSFVLSWYFPNLRLREFGDHVVGRSYGKRFDSAGQVAEHVTRHFDRLVDDTRLWHGTWYDSTLPYWFLDRTFLNTSVLATNTCYLFGDGRFYGYEGVYCCPGTCTHVWGYVQAMGRLFPELERQLREQVDYDPAVSFDPASGRIAYRGEFARGDAVDGQSGVILRTYLAHQMSEDDAFLRRNYASMKKAMDYLIRTYDADQDGILTGGQHNTLDAKWYGKITWLSLHYGAALRAAGQMAEEMGDDEYAGRVRTLADRGRRYIEQELFNGQYFFHEPDPEHLDSPGVFNGCEYSQLLGQSWAYQVGLGYILDAGKVTTALNSLWEYNFSTDVGPFREKFRKGRWYAMPGEGGLIACTWPHGGSEVLGHGNPHFAGYLNECQNGYEYAATSLMMWHGLADKALAHTRALHDRYHASKRNPWNEVECATHYARSMASYGLFTAVCGYEYHGPGGYIAFSPRLTPQDFRAAFTTAAGWGTFEQKRLGNVQTESLELKWGHVKLSRLGFDLPESARSTGVRVMAAGKTTAARLVENGRRVFVVLDHAVDLEAGDRIQVEITFDVEP